MKKISIVIPLHNEAGNITPLLHSINESTFALRYLFEIVFIDDGSRDETMLQVRQAARQDSRIIYLSFSKNFGKDNALMAGLQYSTGDAVITMDADLQHPPELIPELVSWWEKNFDVVYTYREERNEHAGKLSQLGSRMFYRMVNRLSDVKMEDGIADFRLIDKKVVATLASLNEYEPFFRGLLKWAGFSQKGIPYKPAARLAGETTYTYSKLVKLALHGITSFSTKPLEFAIYLGFFFSALSLLYVPYALFSYFTHLAVSGWASIIVTIAFFGGLQLMILGIIGLYLGKVFMQVKQRPQFIISETNLHATSHPVEL